MDKSGDPRETETRETQRPTNGHVDGELPKPDWAMLRAVTKRWLALRSKPSLRATADFNTWLFDQNTCVCTRERVCVVYHSPLVFDLSPEAHHSAVCSLPVRLPELPQSLAGSLILFIFTL